MVKNENSNMYSNRRKKNGNVAALRGCSLDCDYCAFERLVKLNKECPKCAVFEPHFHPEALNKNPPQTKKDEFLTIGLSSDISFAKEDEMLAILDYCNKWKDRTFMIQSKNPLFFHTFDCPKNLILGTTIETNKATFASKTFKFNSYEEISKAPKPYTRFNAMYGLDAKITVTAEPLLDFDLDIFSKAIIDLRPDWIWLGYDSKPERNHLPEPELKKTLALIDVLERNGIKVHRKKIRPAWWELEGKI